MPMTDGSKDEARQELDEFYNLRWLVLSVKNFQKSTVWLDVVTAFCAMRAANTFTVACAWICFIMRIVQLVGVVLRNARVSQAAYLVSTLLITMMFFAEFAKENADIVHESMPTEAQQDEIRAMAGNYGG